VGHYRTAYPGLALSDTIRKINKDVTSQLEEIRWTGLTALHKALTRLEEEMKTQGLALPEHVSAEGESGQDVNWTWDDHRKDYYYWNPRGYFEYHKGDKVNRDGTLYGEAGVSEPKNVNEDDGESEDDGDEGDE